MSTNYGSTWNAAADSGLGSERIQNLIFTNSNLYAFTDSGLFLSSNEGENWSLINGGIMDTVYPYDIIQSGSNLVVATYLGIYFSSNNGLNWNKASGFNPQSPAVMAKFSYNLLSESGDGISLSTDDGENWVELNGIPQNWGNFVGVVSINSILIAANEPAPIINSNLPPPGGIYSSTDNGKTWVMLTSTESPIYNSYIGALVVTGSDIFVVSENEVYRSTDNGNNFNNISGGLPDIGITAFSVNDSSIFVGTNSGIWKLLLSDIINSVKNSTLPSSPKSFVLKQNYPNPFNPSTVIQYQIPINGMVTLKVFDILGREIKTLVNEYKNQGAYTVLFDASKLSSGIYLYQIRSGNFISTKKMILMK